MTTEIERLRAQLASSPGWQRIATEAEKTGETKMQTTTPTTQPEYFVEYVGYWQGERDHFAGPFSTEEEAQAAVADLEIILDCNFVNAKQNARDIKVDKRYRIASATDIDVRDFVAYANPDNDNDTPLLDIYKIQNKKLRRFLGLSPSLGRPAILDQGENVTFRLGTDSREQIAAIREANPELETDTDAVRAALKWYAESIAAKAK
jgi:hypothetical protein